MERDVPVKDVMFIRESLSQAIVEDDDEEEIQAQKSTLNFLWRRLCEFYLDNIPVDIVKQAPNYFKYILGTVCYLIALGLFFYFSYINFISAVDDAFISLTTDSGSCSTVPISITATYLADANGNWQGTASFLYYRSPYSFSFSSFEVRHLSDYQLMMGAYLKDLNDYGEIALVNNLAVALVIWMSYIRFYSTADPSTQNFTAIGSGELQYVQLTGDPTVVFDARYTGLSLGSPHGECKLPATVNYDQANGNFKATMNEFTFINSTICADVTLPFIFEENLSFDPYFSITLDVRSFSTAMAVNLGLIEITNLLLASETELEVEVGTVSYKLGKYFDVRYPLMKSIFCMRNTTIIPEHSPTIKSLCFLSTGSGFFLPVFNHLGNSLTVPEYCDCSIPNVGNSTRCNNFYLVVGLITFGNNHQNTSGNLSADFITVSSVVRIVKLSIDLLAAHGSNYWNLNRAAFPAMSTSVLITINSASSQVRTPQYIRNAYQFCELSENTTDNVVSTYHYPLTQGSCVNSFKVEDSSWEQLADNPPTPLTQIYYKCFPTIQTALVQAVGVASGNTSIAMLLLLFLLVPVVFIFMACFRVLPEEREYKDKEKEVVLDTFATLLLRVRDHHYEAIDENSAISQITEELVRSVAYSNHQFLVEKEVMEGPTTSPAGSIKYHFIDKPLGSSPSTDVNVHREYLGKVYLYRHIQKLHLDQLAFQEMGSPAGGGFAMRTFSGRFTTQSSGHLQQNQDHLNHDIEQTEDRQEIEDSGGHEETLRIRIMNLNEDIEFVIDDPSWMIPYREASLQTIVEGMLFYFSAAIRTQIHKEKRNKGQSAASPPLHQTDLDYAKGCLLSRQLMQMNENELLESKEPLRFVTISNCLGIHASLDLNVDMRIISKDYADRIGYQIGDKIFTYSTLIAFSLRNPLISL